MGLLVSSFLGRFFGPTQSRIVMLGLDAAGKTTVLYKLKLNDVVVTIPTVGFNVEQVQFQNLAMTIWDIGGQHSIRTLWTHYLQNTDALIFIVDSTDRTRFAEVREELWDLLGRDELTSTALLVFANKQDLSEAANPSEVTEALGLFKIKDRPWYVQTACATSGEGLVEGLTWLADKVREKKRRQRSY